MSSKILSISDSPIINEYLREKVAAMSIDLITAKDGFDGIIKMRNLHPELIIMDFNVPKMTLNQFLKDKQELKGTQDIPIILLYSKKDQIDKSLILKLAKLKIFRLILKPIDINMLYNSINQVFNINLEIDKSDCHINVNFNKGNMLFVEISNGINKDKLDLMKYNIIELNKNKKNNVNKGLVIISDIINSYNLDKMLEYSILNITSSSGLTEKEITVLTMDEYIESYFKNKFREIEVSNNYNEVMEKFDVHQDALMKNAAKENNKKEAGANFYPSKVGAINQPTKKMSGKFSRIAIIDGDNYTSDYLNKLFTKKGLESTAFNSGLTFLKRLKTLKPDLIIMDLNLSEINSFELLKHLRKNYYDIPVIILTSLSNKEYILKAKELGVRYYLTKPFNPAIIIEKMEESLKEKSSFIPNNIPLYNNTMAGV